MTSNPRWDPEKKRADIMQKALKLFIEKGFESTSTNDICFAARLTKPSLYHYFKSKEHLLSSVHWQTIETILHPYLAQVTTINDPEKRLRAIIEGFTRVVCTHPELRFILHGSLKFNDKYSSRIREEWKRPYQLVRGTLSELQTSGKINSGLPPSQTALILFGMIAWITFWFDYKRKDKVEDIVRLTTELALHGISFKDTSEYPSCPTRRSRLKKPVL